MTRSKGGVRFTLLAALVVLASVAIAQDVVAVAPGSHKVILENDQVRVLQVHVKAGEKVAMHSHPANVAYFLTDGKLKITLPNGKSDVRTIKAGTANWSDPATHAAENVGSADFEEIQIEMKQPAAKK